mgnify:CR=1 FL=1
MDKLGIPRTTFYRWYDRYQIGGPQALEDQSPRPSRIWNRIPDDVRQSIVDLALDVPELSPRELAVRFTDTEKYFVSEASVYRLLKSLDLITSPAFIVIKIADECCQTNANSSQFVVNVFLLCLTEFASLGKCGVSLKFEIVSGC